MFDDDAKTEVYVEVEKIRTAYLVTIGPDQRVVDMSAP